MTLYIIFVILNKNSFVVMDLFPLFCSLPFNIILPHEIIYMIYIILLKQNSIDTILKHYKIIEKKTLVLKNVISDMIYFNINYTIESKLYFHASTLENFKMILNSQFNREIYPLDFWKHLLDVISNRLMQMHNRFCILGNDKRSNSNYKEFLQIIEVWFKLCKKHNIKLLICKYDNFNKTTISRLESQSKIMEHIKTFKKFVYAPRVILNVQFQELVDTNDSIEILKYYLI